MLSGRTTAKSKHAVAEFQCLKEKSLQDVVTTVEMEEIPSELILNWDKDRPIQHVDHGGARYQTSGRREVNDKQQITAVFCVSLIGDFLPIQVIH